MERGSNKNRITPICMDCFDINIAKIYQNKPRDNIGKMDTITEASDPVESVVN